MPVMPRPLSLHQPGGNSHVPTVISQIKDPLRGEAFDALGIVTLSPTILGADRIREVRGA